MRLSPNHTFLKALLVLAIATQSEALVSCSDDEDTTVTQANAVAGAAGAATTGSNVGGAAGGGGMPLPDRIKVGATRGQLALPFSLDADGEGNGPIGSIAVTDDTGTIEIDGASLPFVAYERQPFSPYVLYQGLAVASDRIYALWLYCLEGQLAYVYFEGTDGTPIDYVTVAGSCNGTETASTADVALPAIDMQLPPLLDGYAIDGPNVHLASGQPGTIDFGGGDPLTILAFDEVDCSRCGAAGWREVHTLLWDPMALRICFAIIYLFEPGDPILVTYSLTLPTLTDPAGNTKLDATWSAP
jgi:hypothetical protein